MKIVNFRGYMTVLIIFLMLTSFIFPVFGTIIEETPKVLSQKPTSYQTHDPIRINSNSEFNTTNGVLSGAGTQNNPYIIGSWEIDGGGNGSCIYVGNTTAHFVINNTYLYNASGNSGQYFWDSGLVLYNVSNAVIRDNNVSQNGGQGIFMMESNNNSINDTECWNNTHEGIRIDNSKDNLIYSNNVSDNNRGSIKNLYGGLQLYQSDNNLLKENYVHDNEYYGLRVYQSSYNILKSNEIIFNCGGEAGMFMQFSDNNVFENNNISNSTGQGIEMRDSDNSIFMNNTIDGNGMVASNPGVYSFNCPNTKWFNNSVCNNSNNGLVAGGSCHYSVFYDNKVGYNGKWGLYVGSSYNCEVYKNRIFWNWESGLYIPNSNDSIAHNNTVWQNNQVNWDSDGGIRLSNSDHITLKDNYIHDNPKCGITLYPGATYNIITNNRVIFNCGGDAAINLESGSHYNKIISNNISNNTNYPIRCQSSTYNEFINNTITGNNNGVYFSTSSHYNSLYDNTLRFNNKMGGQGAFYTYNCENITLINNTISDNFQKGIYLRDAIGSLISKNIISNNAQDGIYMDDMDNLYELIIIENNTISDNDLNGIYDTSYGKQTYKRNIISNNDLCGLNCSNLDFGNITYNTFSNNTEFGVKLDASNNIIIHHNNFINNNGGGVQGNDSGLNNYWNDTNFRGNYWDDYESIYVPPATSNGYIWDIPYDTLGSANSNDSFPLAHSVDFDAPVIVDLSPGNAGTGQKYVIKCDITDDSNVSAVYLFYWFGNDIGSAINVSMVYNSSSGYWEYELPTLPQDKLDQLKYNVSAVDPNSNWNSKKSIVNVTDTIPPTAVAGPDRAIVQGERVRLNASLSTDNIGIVYYKWRFMGNSNDFNFTGKYLNLTFNAAVHWFIELFVEDAAGNNHTDYLWINVSDITKPIIYGPDFPSYVNITEQIDIWISGSDPMTFDGIHTMKLNYTDLNGTTHNVTMTQAFFTQWLYQIPGFPIPGTIKLFFWANDTSGNWNVSEIYYIDILDNILPEIVDLSYPSFVITDQQIVIETEVDDNIGIFEVRINYTDTSSKTYNVSMNPMGGDKYNFTIPGQSSTGMVMFHVWVVDEGNNSVKSKTYEIQVVKKHISVKLPEINWVTIPPKVNINEPIKLEVNVTDESGIDSVRLNYTDVHGKFKNVTMTDDGDGKYSYIIPNQTSVGYVDVYVAVKNSLGAWNRTQLRVIEVVEIKDITPPRVLASTPEHEDTDVKTNIIVSIIFSEGMNTTSVATGLDIKPVVEYDLAWFDNNVLMKITFKQNLSYNTQYDITIGLAAKDVPGNRLDKIYTISFTTEKELIIDNDKDDDGIDDAWELEKGLDPTNKNDAGFDNDSDGLTNLEEFEIGTEPFNSDTDGDQLPDGWEYDYYPDMDPLVSDAEADLDGDFFSNLEEYKSGTDPSDEESKPTTKKKDQPDDYSILIGIIILVIIILILLAFLISRMRKPAKKEEVADEKEAEKEAIEIECQDCGAMVPAGETECAECGAKLPEEEEAAAEEEELGEIEPDTSGPEIEPPEEDLEGNEPVEEELKEE